MGLAPARSDPHSWAAGGLGSLTAARAGAAPPQIALRWSTLVALVSPCHVGASNLSHVDPSGLAPLP